jgi:hypothetical protein
MKKLKNLNTRVDDDQFAKAKADVDRYKALGYDVDMSKVIQIRMGLETNLASLGIMLESFGAATRSAAKERELLRRYVKVLEKQVKQRDELIERLEAASLYDRNSRRMSAYNTKPFDA